jgi:hypothetical protein
MLLGLILDSIRDGNFDKDELTKNTGASLSELELALSILVGQGYLKIVDCSAMSSACEGCHCGCSADSKSGTIYILTEKGRRK